MAETIFAKPKAFNSYFCLVAIPPRIWRAFLFFSKTLQCKSSPLKLPNANVSPGFKFDGIPPTFFKGTFTRGKGTIKSELGLAKVKNQVDEIRKQSVEIAEGFMSHTEYTGSIDQALSASDIYETTEEGRSYRVSDLNTKVFNSVINSLNNAIRLLKAMPGASVKSIQAIKNEGFKAFNADSSISEEAHVLQAIATMVNELYGNSVAIDERLASVEERA